MEKSQIRRKMILKRNNLSRKQIFENSKKILNRLCSSSYYKNANHIMIYVSINKEVFTHSFIENALSDGKKIIVPKCEPSSKKIILSQIRDFQKDLEKGFKGLMEPKKEALRPVSIEQLDLILVPGLAFTKSGDRLGYGGGYYDRFLANTSKEIPKIALAFEIQIVPTLPVDFYDIPIDFIVTEKRWITCK